MLDAGAMLWFRSLWADWVRTHLGDPLVDPLGVVAQISVQAEGSPCKPRKNGTNSSRNYSRKGHTTYRDVTLPHSTKIGGITNETNFCPTSMQQYFASLRWGSKEEITAKEMKNEDITKFAQTCFQEFPTIVLAQIIHEEVARVL